jgi:hypothetical protein
MKISVAGLAGAAALTLLLAPALAPAAAPAGRYNVSGGVVQDIKTGLSWQQAPAPTKYSFADAISYCSSNAAALPGSGWRLPAIKELRTLIDDSVAPPSFDASTFPAGPNGIFWSSTPYAPSASTRAWSFGGGVTDTSMTALLSVRCVR